MDTLVAAKILKDDFTTILVLCNLASCLLLQGQASAAINILNQALVLQPNHPRALERRATAYYQIGKIENAESDLKTGLQCVNDKKLENKMKDILQSIKVDKEKKKQMYKKMIEKKKKVDLPDWVTNITKIAVVTFECFSSFKNVCRRKKSS